MKTAMLIAIAAVGLSLGGCMSNSSNNFNAIALNSDVPPTMQSNQYSEKLDKLLQSCELGKDERLQAADSVMEKIVKLSTSNGKIKKNTDPDLYQAGSVLYKLTDSFYADNISVEDCRKKVESIGNYLRLAKVDLDSINFNTSVLTTSK